MILVIITFSYLSYASMNPAALSKSSFKIDAASSRTNSDSVFKSLVYQICWGLQKLMICVVYIFFEQFWTCLDQCATAIFFAMNASPTKVRLLQFSKVPGIHYYEHNCIPTRKSCKNVPLKCGCGVQNIFSTCDVAKRVQ